MTQVATNNKSQLQVSNANLANPGGMLELAGTVKQFILDQKLYAAIQNRNYVNVEGWQFAGGMIGVVPIAKGTENLSTADEFKYKASVELLNIHTQQIVGAGFATCSNKEKGKKYFDEYAIESMAQTRAVGKAYRLMLGWLIKAAGYESTPAEEMEFQQAEVVESKPAPAKQPTTAPVEKAQPVAEAEALEQAQATEAKYATARQKEEIIRLLNNECITKQEKTKMLLNINKLDEDRANTSIQKLKATIEERTGKPVGMLPVRQADPATSARREFILKLIKSHVFTDIEEEEVQSKCEDNHFTVASAADYIDQIEKTLKARKELEKAAA